MPGRKRMEWSYCIGVADTNFRSKEVGHLVILKKRREKVKRNYNGKKPGKSNLVYSPGKTNFSLYTPATEGIFIFY